MKKKAVKLMALVLCIGLIAATLTACGNSDSIDPEEYNRIMEENRQMREQLGDPVEPETGSTSSSTSDAPSNSSKNSGKGDPESDFEFEHRNNAITITGYIGTKNDIVIPASINGSPVTAIGGSGVQHKGAFQDFTSLTSIIIPDSVTSIGMEAFKNCISLGNINIPYGVTTIGMHAFFSSGLTSITFSDSVTDINQQAFAGCSGLTSLIIPDSVTGIGRGAFEDCTGLTSITIPDVTFIGDDAFERCDSLASITYNGITYDRNDWENIPQKLLDAL